ncbi:MULTISPECIES: hypothetical protein [Vibrio]|uniref:hypothetical protein n=1 Tax=Vibrio TaxID=662 RepID=UPI000BFFA135|nr:MULTISPECIES: hypothetical protein [unclassified Vibrio]PHJ40560.1 hypothetical protein AK965_15960 [Vibrio sp. PID17_43]RIZ55337.1 hypothetical protein AK966_08450 [Vibrio sp. PID23_8]
MSAVIKTTTPFVMEEILFQALESIGAEPVKINQQNIAQTHHSGGLVIGDILTNRSDYYGRQHFRQENGKWLLRHDSSEMNGRVENLNNSHYKPVRNFLHELSSCYLKYYEQHLEKVAEQERIRLEEERKARVEATKRKAIEKAKAQGYSVKETLKGNQIQLVLVRTV